MGAEVFQAARCNEWKGDFGMQHCVGVCRNAVVHVGVGLSCRVEGWSTWCCVPRTEAIGSCTRSVVELGCYRN